MYLQSICEILKLKVRSSKNIPRAKQSKLVLRACFCYLSERRSLLPQVKCKSCLKATLKSILRISRAWSTRFVLTLAGTIKRKGGIHKGGKEFSFSLRVHMRACPHCTEKCVRQLAHICSRGQGSVRAATAGTVAPSHPLLAFGKLTSKFELLSQFPKAESRRPSAAAYGKAVPSHLSYLRSAS